MPDPSTPARPQSIDELLTPRIPPGLIAADTGLVVVFENRFETIAIRPDVLDDAADVFAAAPTAAPIAERVALAWAAAHPGKRVGFAGPDPRSILDAGDDADVVVVDCSSRLDALAAAVELAEQRFVIAARLSAPGLAYMGRGYWGTVSSLADAATAEELGVTDEDYEWARFDIDRRNLPDSVDDVAKYRRVALDLTEHLRGLICALDMPAAPSFAPRVWVDEIAVVSPEYRWDLAAGDDQGLYEVIKQTGLPINEAVTELHKCGVLDRPVAAAFYMELSKATFPGDRTEPVEIDMGTVARDKAGLVAIPLKLLETDRGLIPLWELLPSSGAAKAKLPRNFERQLVAAGRQVIVVGSDDAPASAGAIDAIDPNGAEVIMIRHPDSLAALWSAVRLAQTRLVALADIADDDTSDIHTGCKSLAEMLYRGIDETDRDVVGDEDRQWATVALQRRDDASWTLDDVARLAATFRALRTTLVGGVCEVAFDAAPAWPSAIARAREVAVVDELSFLGSDLDNLEWAYATMDRNGLPGIDASIKELIDTGAISPGTGARFLARLVLTQMGGDED